MLSAYVRLLECACVYAHTLIRQPPRPFIFPLRMCVCIFNADDRIQESEEWIIIRPFCRLFFFFVHFFFYKSPFLFFIVVAFFRQFWEQRCLLTVTWKVFDVRSESWKCVHTIGWLGKSGGKMIGRKRVLFRVGNYKERERGREKEKKEKKRRKWLRSKQARNE